MPTIAIINTSEDTIEMLRIALAHHGFSSVASAHVVDLRKGRQDFNAFLGEHDPRVLIYDIGIPYDRNWAFLQSLLDLPQMRGRRVIVTTTNKDVLEQLVGPSQAIEIHGKPYDIEQIVRAVEKAIERGSGAGPT